MSDAPSNEVKINRGLKGIYFERSGVSDIDGSKGELSYRGYSIHDLAGQASFEETGYLLIHGELPNQTQFDAFDAEMKAARTLPGRQAIRFGLQGSPSMGRLTTSADMRRFAPATTASTQLGRSL